MELTTTFNGTVDIKKGDIDMTLKNVLGHSIILESEETIVKASLEDRFGTRTYDSSTFHFHSPSEHLVNNV